TPTYSEIIGKTLAKFAETNQKLVAITAAMPSGTGLSHFAKAHPTRYFDVGIAEEHATLFACGLATQGMTPFLTIYSTFFQRAYLKRKEFRSRASTRAGSSRWTPAHSNFSREASKSSARLKITFCTTVLAAR